MMSRAVTTAACVIALTGCAAFVDKADYADYRHVRLARGEGDRLLAIQRYVNAHPDGHWSAELRAEQVRREVEVYESGKDTRAGLDLYLQAYPGGQFVAQAQARLAVMTQIEARKAEERAATERAAEDKRVRDEELRRTWVTRFASYWVETLLAVRQWGEPIADIARLNPDFSRAFGKSPRPQCSTTECVKHYRSSYGVPVPGGNRLERSIEVTLRLSLRDGRVARVELLFPRRGFSRWFELENRRAIVDEDPQMRTEAIAWAMEKVKPWLAKLGEPRSEVSDLVFDPVLAPTLGPNGEVTDTTATDPSSQIQGVSADAMAPNAPGEEQAAIPVPATDQPAPDMVIGPIVIPEQGHRVQADGVNSAPGPAPSEGAGEIMTLGPIEAGPTAPPSSAGGESETMTLGAIEAGGADGTPPSATTPATVAAPTLPIQLYALSSGDLRVVVFAESAGGWDGLRIERVVAAPANSAGAARPARAGARR